MILNLIIIMLLSFITVLYLITLLHTLDLYFTNPMYDFRDSETGLDEMLGWIDRLHSVVLGPGLGRDERVLKALEVQCFKSFDDKVIVIDR